MTLLQRIVKNIQAIRRANNWKELLPISTKQHQLSSKQWLGRDVQLAKQLFHAVKHLKTEGIKTSVTAQ